MVGEGSLRFFLEVHSGVLQGCPLSALLSNSSIGPLVCLFTTMVVRSECGLVLTCADDLAATLNSLRFLKSIASAFSLSESISDLKLRTRKCVIVLNSIRATPANVSVIRQWLSEHIPAWADLIIGNCARYLGFYMGPTSFCWQWDMPIQKFKQRLESRVASGEPAAFSVRQYSIRAVPVLSYLSQLVLHPHNLSQIETAATNRILHFATNAASMATIACKTSTWACKASAELLR